MIKRRHSAHFRRPAMLVFAGLLVLCFGSFVQGAPSRIVGGHDAPNHKYPYQVILRTSAIGFYCSGSILNEHWVLTAAHCVYGTTNITVTVGTNFLNETGVTYREQFNVIHEDYVSFTYYDIALIRIDGEIKFNEFVQPIALPNEDLTDHSVPAVMTGWGRFGVELEFSNALQEIFLNVLSYDECKADLGKVTPEHICTYNKMGEGICHGDSGGPLAVGGVQVGIASYIMFGCGYEYPDVFTRVWSYRDWIDSTMQRYQ